MFNYESIKKGGFCYFFGFDRCLFLYFNLYRFLEIFMILIFRLELLVLSDVVWILFSFKGFYKNIGSFCSIFKENGNLSFYVFR